MELVLARYVITPADYWRFIGHLCGPQRGHASICAMKTLATALLAVLLLAGCDEAPEIDKDFELNASLRAVDMESGEEQLWLHPDQALPVLRFVIKEYLAICDGVLCEYRAEALENLITGAEPGSPQYELSAYLSEDKALQYVVEELFPLLIQVHSAESAEANTMMFIESAESDELVETQSASTAVITAQDGQLFRALAAGRPDTITTVSCVSKEDLAALGDNVHSQIRQCPLVDVPDHFRLETERLLDIAKQQWEDTEHLCNERPCHGLYEVAYFGEQRYVLFNWGYPETFVSDIQYQVCANQEHDNAWACLFDLASDS